MKLLMKYSLLMLILPAMMACATNDSDTTEPAANKVEGSYIRPYQKTYDNRNRRQPKSVNRNASGLPDPMKAHLMARKQVNPNDTRSSHPYTKNTKPYSARTRSKQLVNKNTVTAVPIPTKKAVTLSAFTNNTNNNSTVLNAPLPPALKPILKPEAPLLQNSTPGQNFVIPAKKPVTRMKHSHLNQIQTASGTSTAPLTQNQSQTIIESVRVGDHADKTRIVFDADHNASFKPILSTDRTAILITFDNTYWGAHLSKTYARSPLLRSYAVKNKNGKTMVTLSFKRPVRIAESAVYPPETAGQKYRIVLDVVAR